MRNVNQGFTLIEGISVMLILGVLTAFAAPRLSGNDQFSVISTRDMGLSVARQVQLRAMQQESPLDQCNALKITDSRLGSSDDAICARRTNRTDVLDLKGSDITISVIDEDLPLSVLHFDLLGRPFAADRTTRLCLKRGCEITFKKGGVSSSFCLNAEGYFDVTCSG